MNQVRARIGRGDGGVTVFTDDVSVRADRVLNYVAAITEIEPDSVIEILHDTGRVDRFVHGVKVS